MNCLAVIPARSGSKGLKDKNIKELAGVPLLAYSIKAAKESGLFGTVHVSTDSDSYAEIAREYGADVPFLRSEEMSSDTASSWDTVLEVLRRYAEQGKEFDMVTLLQPTSPLRTGEDIKAAYDIFTNKNANAVVSVCEMDHSPLWANTIPDDGSMDNFLDKIKNLPRQQLPTYYRINGAIYMVDVKYLKENTDIYRRNSFSYVMPKERSVDIDTQFDFDMATTLIK